MHLKATSRYSRLFRSLTMLCLLLLSPLTWSQQAGDKSIDAQQTTGQQVSEAEIPENSTAPALNDQLDTEQKLIQAKVDELQLLRANPGNSILGRELVQQYLFIQQTIQLKKQLDYIKSCLKADASHPCRQFSATLLKTYPEQLANAYKTITQIELPAADSSPADQTLAFSKLFEQIEQFDQQDAMYIESLELAKQLDAYDPQFASELNLAVQRRAASMAMLLDRTLREANSLREALTLLPNDEALKAKLGATEGRARKLGAALQRVSRLINVLGGDIREYEKLVLTATGQLSAEAISSGMLTQLLAGWSKQLTEFAIKKGPGLVIKGILVVIILFVTWRIARLLQKLTSAALQRSKQPVSLLLHRMVVNTVGNLTIIIGVLIALSQLGISLGPLLAGVGVVGFVVGFALQDTLSNFASGVMILVYGPFDVGDVVETGGVFGKVHHMSLVNTTILTLDNQTIVVPNNKIWGEVIKNLTHQNQRRIDMVFGIAYDADSDKATEILNAIITEDERILDEPEPVIRLHELADSSVNFVVRPWVNTEDYWEVRWDTTREVKKRFDAAGIGIPFPQRDIHLDASEPLTIRMETNS